MIGGWLAVSIASVHAGRIHLNFASQYLAGFANRRR
jgi:hypothetical protein